MKKSEFFKLLEAFKWIVRGNGREIAKRAGITYDQYLTSQRGGDTYDDVRTKIAEAIKTLHSELPKQNNAAKGESYGWVEIDESAVTEAKTETAA